MIFLGFPTKKHSLVLDFPSGKHVKGRKEVFLGKTKDNHTQSVHDGKKDVVPTKT